MVDARRAVVQLFVAAVLGGAVAGVVSACFIWTVERGIELVWVDLPERLDVAPFDSWWLVAVPVAGGVLAAVVLSLSAVPASYAGAMLFASAGAAMAVLVAGEIGWLPDRSAGPRGETAA